MRDSTAEHAAWIVASLPPAEAELILRRLPDSTADALRARAGAANSLRMSREQAAVVRRFIGEFPGHTASRVHRVDGASERNPFHFLWQQLPSRVASILSHELPQTAATVLTQLPAHQAADVLAHLPAGLQRAIAAHLRDSGPVSPFVLEELADELAQRLNGGTSAGPIVSATGREQLAEIISCADQATRERLGAV